MSEDGLDLTTEQRAMSGPVYLAGPMFSQADVKWQLEVAGTLESAGLSTHLPQRDGIEVASVMAKIGLPFLRDPLTVIEVTRFARKLVFALDVYHVLERCQAIVFNLDGRVPDEGTVMEASLGWTANRPVVVFKTTSISMLGGYDNPMVSGLGMKWAYVTELDKLAAEVKRAIKARQDQDDHRFALGHHAATVVALGAEIWARMPAIRQVTELTADKIPDAVRALRQELRPLLEAADLWEDNVPEGMQPVS